MGTFIAVNWFKIAGLIVTAFGVWKYFDSRRRELKWKKTEFLFAESKYLSDDEDLSECIQILEDRHPKYKIKDIYPDVDENATNELLEYRHKFEKLLNFFDRHAYAMYSQKTVEKVDLEYYGWYLKLLKSNPNVIEYCNTYGFSDVVKLANEITWSG